MEENKGFFGTITKGIGDAFGWIGRHYNNAIRGIGNWFGGVETSADLGEISGLKKQLTIMLTKFAFSFKRQLVNEAKENGKEAAKTKENVGKSKDSILSGKANAGDISKNMRVVSSKGKDLSGGKSVNDLLNNAKNKSDAINKTNQSLGMTSISNPTKSVGRN